MFQALSPRGGEEHYGSESMAGQALARSPHVHRMYQEKLHVSATVLDNFRPK